MRSCWMVMAARRGLRRTVWSALALCLLVLVAACDDVETESVKARIGEVWDLNIHTNIESLKGLSAVDIRDAEVQFDGEDQPIKLQATSPNRNTWYRIITTEGFLQSVDPHEPLTFTLSTVIPDNPDWIGRTGRIRWQVTITYPRLMSDDRDRFEDKTTDTTVEYAIKFLEKAKDG